MSKKIASLLALSISMCGVMANGAEAKTAPDANAAVKTAPAKTDSRFDFLPAVVATTKDGNVTKEELIAFILEQTPNGELPPSLSADELKAAAPDLIKTLVMTQMLTKEMKKDGIVPNKEQTKKMLMEVFDKAPEEQKDGLKGFLASQNKTIDSYFDEEANRPATQLQAAMSEWIQKNFSDKYKASDADIEKFYKDRSAEFTEPTDPADAIRASHILVSVKPDATAEEDGAAKAKVAAIQARLAKGEDFKKVAMTESSCPSGVRSGGSLGAFKKGKMVPEFEEAALKLKDDEVSAPVRTKFGYHIIRREKLKEGGQIPLADVRDFIAQTLNQENTRNAFSAKLEELEKSSNIELKVEAPKAPEANPAVKK